jgi:23S rRNA pseudouridine1911/1915/1917 synthase
MPRVTEVDSSDTRLELMSPRDGLIPWQDRLDPNQEPIVSTPDEILPPMPPDENGIQERILCVEAEAAGRRLDVWLALRFPRHSRATLAQLVHIGRVEGLDRPLKPSSLLLAGERVRMWRPGMNPDAPPPPLPPVLYEDERLLAVDKPAGMLVHPSGSTFVWALVGLVRAARPGMEVHLAHRLDRDTSGVVLVAKDASANRHFKEVFRQKRIEKTYLALVLGRPEWSHIIVDAAIGRSLTSAIHLRMGVCPDGAQASTEFQVMARFNDFALLACRPKTGRTHQIRVHLEHVGHPILGDRIYGQPDATFVHVFEHGFDDWALARVRLDRQALHAWRLRLPHPDGRSIEIQAPLPEDLREVMRVGRLPRFALGDGGGLGGS